MSTQQDVDNLLEGLQAEDLDMDLDLDLDYDPEELAFGGTDQTVVDRDAGTEFDGAYRVSSLRLITRR